MRSPKAKRVRNINKNKLVVDTINRYFPQDRASFGQGERSCFQATILRLLMSRFGMSLHLDRQHLKAQPLR